MGGEFQLDMDYVDSRPYGETGYVADQLIFRKWSGLDRTKFKVSAVHDEDCADSSVKHYVFDARDEGEQESTGTNGLLRYIIPVAFAASLAPSEQVIDALRSKGGGAAGELEFFFSKGGDDVNKIAIDLIVSD